MESERKENYKTYFGRYYVLTAISLLSAHQNVSWATFGSIAIEAWQAYGLTAIEVTLLPAYGSLGFILFTIPFVWCLKRFGLRVVGVSGAWILALGCTMRVFVPYAPNASDWVWLIHVGHILIGYVGLPVMILPPKISSIWFSPKERVFATAVAVTSQSLGVALGFIMNPYLTQEYSIRTMLIVQAEMSLFIAIFFSIYFPPHPPTPPSVSAKEERVDFMKSLKELLRNHSYIVLVLSGGIVMGGSFGFQSVLSVILNPSSGFNDKVKVDSIWSFLRSTSWMGAVSAILGSISGQITGLLADRFQRKFKVILLVLMSLTTLSVLWFALSIYGWGSSNPVNLFITYSLFYTFSFASMPIYYEAAVEATYPISEGISGGILTLSCNAAILIFAVIGLAGVFSLDHPERAKAMTWTMTGLSTLSLLILLFYFEHYKRLSVDTATKQKENQNKCLSKLLPDNDEKQLLLND
ncbi:PREDICTED: disrupted in renal carcinoma protein 2 homolog isoform X2 [Amphimedon queenslandica]|uniref:Major facilitator superfamily (MFS) profile domain-containing protein n=1 Tax=Amphimedon queenslandica TaxID=400682 RepID=A0AAN0J8V4_AMPQE|nr:PREDICTED: disrupted in renal carcinoma protein 2 homolog isoform X2 [Amphimedon queenslandica]|eukprot:XP_019853138.1 PREDICTED: disrupted in renal carcinoma protein 2 homolog isoform X2 [Amphimedon queenslandica]